MKKILLVGEHPFGTTGNSGFMLSMLEDISYQDFQVTAFVAETSLINNTNLTGQSLPFNLISAHEVRVGTTEQDTQVWGHKRLFDLLRSTIFDFVVFVGLDVWRYAPIFPHLKALRQQQKNKYIAIIPYDLQTVRADWIKWIDFFDFPYIYSEYGYNLIKKALPKVRYFRPRPRLSRLFTPFSNEDCIALKKQIVPDCTKETVLFGFVGKNQFRKDPQKLIKAFSLLKEQERKGKYGDIDFRLYMHTPFEGGIFNLKQYGLDCGLSTGDLMAKSPNFELPAENMPNIYASFDVLVNCSIQEGLSWTPIEAGLCGVPSILSDSTAHKDLTFGDFVPCKIPTAVPMATKFGNSWVDGMACLAEDIYNCMEKYQSVIFRKEQADKALMGARLWLLNCSSINELLDECITTPNPVVQQKDRVLFIQRSSAGDVFMTTRCFNGLKERYGLPIDYMTESPYMNIVQNNPFIDKVIAWSEEAEQEALYEYAYVLNPHKEKILPGHWGRNSNSLLSDFYWKILKVVPNPFLINEQPVSNFDLPKKPICIVHTTGGDPEFRTYKYMADVCSVLKNDYYTIQLGGNKDYPANAECDLRGKLTFQESAWIVKQAKIAVTVDSFISHLCGAYGVSQVCLFGSGNAHVVRPNQMSGDLICMFPDYINVCPGLGPCSASVRDCPVKCTGRHSPEKILEQIKVLERNLV